MYTLARHLAYAEVRVQCGHCAKREALIRFAGSLSPSDQNYSISSRHRFILLEGMYALGGNVVVWRSLLMCAEEDTDQTRGS